MYLEKMTNCVCVVSVVHDSVLTNTVQFIYFSLVKFIRRINAIYGSDSIMFVQNKLFRIFTNVENEENETTLFLLIFFHR